jgi:hypothetical protein
MLAPLNRALPAARTRADAARSSGGASVLVAGPIVTSSTLANSTARTLDLVSAVCLLPASHADPAGVVDVLGVGNCQGPGRPPNRPASSAARTGAGAARSPAPKPMAADGRLVRTEPAECGNAASAARQERSD